MLSVTSLLPEGASAADFKVPSLCQLGCEVGTEMECSIEAVRANRVTPRIVHLRYSGRISYGELAERTLVTGPFPPGALAPELGSIIESDLERNLDESGYLLKGPKIFFSNYQDDDDDDDRDEPGFRLAIPPRTYIYTEREEFWYMLNLRSFSIRELVPTQARPEGRRVYGFFNDSLRATAIFASDLQPRITAQTTVRAMADDLDLDLTGSFTLTIESLDKTFEFGGMTGDTFTADQVAFQLKAAMSDIERDSNLNTEFVSVDTLAEDAIEIRSAELPDSRGIRVDVTVSDNPGLTILPSRELVFPLEKATSYLAKLVRPAGDALERLYPVTLLGSPGTGMGTSVAFLPKLGFSGLLGVAYGPNNVRFSSFTLQSEGSHNIRVHFTDRDCEPLRLADDVQVYIDINLNLTPSELFSASQLAGPPSYGIGPGPSRDKYTNPLRAGKGSSVGSLLGHGGRIRGKRRKRSKK